jgi:hypothetical protein
MYICYKDIRFCQVDLLNCSVDKILEICAVKFEFNGQGLISSSVGLSKKSFYCHARCISPERQGATGEWRKFHELHTLHRI